MVRHCSHSFSGTDLFKTCIFFSSEYTYAHQAEQRSHPSAEDAAWSPGGGGAATVQNITGIFVTCMVKPAEPNRLYLWHRMQNLVEGGKELSPYLQWQKDMREQDLQEELAKIDRKHLEGRISHEEAAAARVRLMERNRETAKLTKEEVCQ